MACRWSAVEFCLGWKERRLKLLFWRNVRSSARFISLELFRKIGMYHQFELTTRLSFSRIASLSYEFLGEEERREIIFQMSSQPFWSSRNHYPSVAALIFSCAGISITNFIFHNASRYSFLLFNIRQIQKKTKHFK